MRLTLSKHKIFFNGIRITADIRAQKIKAGRGGGMDDCMLAIMRRELSAYFHSPIGYIFLGAFYALSGFYFTIGSLFLDSADLTRVFSSMFTVALFLIPILTMRLMSEDLRQKTDQALLTAPVTLTGLVLGKFLSALIVFMLGLSVTLVYTLIFQLYTTPDWAAFWGNFIALLLLGMALIAIGLFISSLTQNQVIAATGGFAAALLLMLLDIVPSMFQNQLLTLLVSAISFYNRYYEFTLGVFAVSNVFFFLSVCAVFLFLSVRVFEKRRWA